MKESEIKFKWKSDWKRLINGGLTQIPGGENIIDVGNRGFQAMSEYYSLFQSGKVCIIGHGAFNRILILRLLNAPVEYFSRLPQSSVCINTFDFSVENVAFHLIADNSHLKDTKECLVIR